VVAAALLVGVAAAGGVAWQMQHSDAQALAAQAVRVEKLQAELDALEKAVAARPDWSAVASQTEPSVFTIEAGSSLGSAWVLRADPSGSDLITNFHVVAGAWTSGQTDVQLQQGDRAIPGQIIRVDEVDDIALIHVLVQLPPLQTDQHRLQIGTAVMAIGSPLGLGGTASFGYVSGYRSLEGSDYMQFSAPISPGNSGGPIVDLQGRVVGVASAKFVGDGVEGLGLAIPIAVACIAFVKCPV
jgi:putative serine protease PepD